MPMKWGEITCIAGSIAAFAVFLKTVLEIAKLSPGIHNLLGGVVSFSIDSILITLGQFSRGY